MALMAHDIQCVALKQLETALRLYFEREDYYSVITLAGAAEEVFGSLLFEKLKDTLCEYFEHEGNDSAMTSIDSLVEVIKRYLKKLEDNNKLCEEILEKLRDDEEPTGLQTKLQHGRGEEKKFLRDMEGIVNEELLEVSSANSDEKKEGLKNLLENLRNIFNSHKPTLGSLTDAGVEIGNLLDGETPSRRGVIGAANNVKNILKHGLLDETNIVEFDAPEEAKGMLDRAISNYFQLTSNLTPAMERFCNEDMYVQDRPEVRLLSEDDEEFSATQ